MRKTPPMIIVSEAAPRFKTFLAHCDLKPLARTMMMRIVLAFIMHRGRMSCSAAAGVIASEPIHRGELTRFLARPRWQKYDFNEPLMRMLLAKEKKQGKFLFLIDATLVSQAGTTVLYLEHERITHMLDRRLSKDRREWWERQRLHGLCHAFRQEAECKQLKYIEERTKTSGGLKKLQRLLAAAIPQEYRVAA